MKKRLRYATVSLLCPYSAQNNADNTDNWKDTKLHSSTEPVDFSLNYWLLMLYGKICQPRLTFKFIESSLPTIQQFNHKINFRWS